MKLKNGQGLMMTIQSIKIENFQSHKDTELDLSPGVNVIIGVSDSGKSAIIRALKWITFNRPLGEAFRSSWGGITKVTMELEKHQVIRLKEGVKNVYKTDGHSFHAIGTDVPDEIKQRIGLDQVNFQGQIDPHFMFTLSPGDVAEYLNKLVGLKKIDLGSATIKSVLSSINQKLTALESSKASYELQVKDYANVPALDKKIGKVENMESVKKDAVQRKEVIDDFLIKYSFVQRDLEIVKDVKHLKDRVQKVQELVSEWSTTLDKSVDLLCQIEQAKLLSKLIQKLPKPKSVDGLIKDEQELKNKRDSIKKLNGLVLLIQRVSKEINQVKNEIQKDEDTFKELMPDVCPLCGSTSEVFSI